MQEHQILLTAGFFIVALIYSSVGFGGGSSYLALLAVFNTPLDTLRPAALMCNIIVVTGGTIIFYREGKLDLRKVWPFLACSIPLAFVGGYWKLSEAAFFILLSASLIAAAFLLWIRPERLKRIKSDHLLLNMAVGGGTGFLSGLVSIGGGIFLSPILHLIGWDEAKKISAAASAFILVNSISGLAGQFSREVNIDWQFALPLLLAVLTGGQIGSRLGARVFDPLIIKRVTAVLVFIAGVNILADHL